MNWSQNRLALLVALLLVGSAALYAVGTAIEHHKRAAHQERTAAISPAPKSSETATEKKATDENAGTSTGETTTESTDTTTTSAESGGETHSEKIAGIDPESWPLVGAAIAASLLLAAGVYWRRGRWLAAAVAFPILFAAGDIREVVHQIQESRTTVATIAGILIALHLLTAAAAAYAIRQRGTPARAVPEPS